MLNKKYILPAGEKTTCIYHAFFHEATNFNILDRIVLWLLGYTKK